MHKQTVAFFALIGLAAGAQAGALQTLDSLNKNFLGVNLTGSVKGTFLKSDMTGAQVDPRHPASESFAATEANLDIGVHPSQNVGGIVRLRLHQDWNKSYDEGVNQMFPVWWNLNGKADRLNLKMSFGDLLVSRGKLNLFDGSVDPIAYEAPSLAERRQEAMAYKNVDGKSRHIQGVNVDFTHDLDKNSALNAVFMGARLRNPWWNTAVVQPDNAPVEKWYTLMGVAYKGFGVEAGVDHSIVYDKVRSTRGFQIFAPKIRAGAWLDASVDAKIDAPFNYEVELDYENNTVTNVYAGYKSDSTQAFSYSARFDYAMTNWTHNKDVYVFWDPTQVNGSGSITDPAIAKNDQSFGWVLNPELKNQTTGQWDKFGFDSLAYRIAGDGDVNYKIYNDPTVVRTNLRSGTTPWRTLDGTGMLLELNGKYKWGAVEYAQLNVKYLQNDSAFVSDMAQSYGYNASPMNRNVSSAVLNSKQVGGYSVFDGLYNYSYQVNPSTFENNTESVNPLDLKPYAGTNNSFRLPFDKTHWSDEMQTKTERDGIALQNIAYGSLLQVLYPQGYATPNRSGFDLALNGEVMPGIKVAAFFAQNKSVTKEWSWNGAAYVLDNHTYAKMGVGVAANLGQTLDLGRKINIGFGFEQPKITAETNAAANVTGTVLSGGADIEVMPWMSVRGAYMKLQGGKVLDVEEYMGAGVVFEVGYAATLAAEWQQFTATAKVGNIAGVKDYKQVIPRVALQMAF